MGIVVSLFGDQRVMKRLSVSNSVILLGKGKLQVGTLGTNKQPKYN